MSVAQRISARCQRYLGDMGVSLQVWVHAMETPHDKLFVFKPDELKSLNLVTAAAPASVRHRLRRVIASRQRRVPSMPRGRMEPSLPDDVVCAHWRFAMRVFLGMILGALLLVVGVYIRDSMSTSTVANGQVA